MRANPNAVIATLLASARRCRRLAVPTCHCPECRTAKEEARQLVDAASYIREQVEAEAVEGWEDRIGIALLVEQEGRIRWRNYKPPSKEEVEAENARRIQEDREERRASLKEYLGDFLDKES